MNRAFQYSFIGLSFLLGFLANVYLGGEGSQSIASQHTETQSPVIVDVGQTTQQMSSRDELTKIEQSNSVVDNTIAKKQLRTGDDSQQQDVNWPQQKAQVEAELLVLSRTVTKLNQRYLSAKAKLDSLKYNSTDINSRLVGTSFELLQSKLSASEWQRYKAFDDLVDTHASSYELQTILSDYFILHVNSDVTSLYAVDCKSNMCILYLYSNHVGKSLETFQAIDKITDEYKLQVREFRSFGIEQGTYSNENFKVAFLVTVVASEQ
jgi:hypothetical protein